MNVSIRFLALSLLLLGFSVGCGKIDTGPAAATDKTNKVEVSGGKQKDKKGPPSPPPLDPPPP